MKVRLRGPGRGFLERARRRYAPFAAGGPPDLTLDVSTFPEPRGRRRLEPKVRPIRGGVRVERHDLEADLGPREGRAAVLGSAAALDALLRIALSFALVRRGGFLCHAAAVGGWLFPGRSGAGKSTLGRSVPRGRLLADELVGVVGRRLESTPFWGDFRAGRQNGARPLRAILFLDRRAPRGVRPLPKAEALARLLECVFYVGDDPPAARKLFRAARAGVESVPTGVLSYDARRTSFAALERMIGEELR
jgi:hypothetical protein